MSSTVLEDRAEYSRKVKVDEAEDESAYGWTQNVWDTL